VLSIERAHAAVIACFAGPQALDALPSQAGTLRFPVAPDELLLIAPPSLAADIERRAGEHFAAAEPSALVLDQSDGWCTFTLRGEESDTLFAQLSTVPLPARRQAFLQGAVAGGSAKMIVLERCIHVLVPSSLRHHVAARIQDVCRGRAVAADDEIAFATDPETPPFDAGDATPAMR